MVLHVKTQMIGLLVNSLEFEVVKSGLEAQSMACVRVHLQLQAHAMSRGQAKQEVSEPVSDGDEEEDGDEKGEGDLDNDPEWRTIRKQVSQQPEYKC